MAQFFADNWYWLGPALLAAGGVIVKATPTKTDDAWARKAIEIWKAVKK